MFTISGGDNEGVTPVPIPNTEVKPFSADGTWLVTVRESRSPPDSIFLSSSMAEHSAVNRRVVGSSPTWGAKKPGRKTRSFCIPRRNLINMSFQRTASVRALPGSNPSATSVGAAGIAGASALCLRSGRFLLCRTAHRAAASFAPLGSTKTGSGLNCFAGTLF